MNKLIFLCVILVSSVCSAQGVDVEVQGGQESKTPSIITVNTSSEKCIV